MQNLLAAGQMLINRLQVLISEVPEHRMVVLNYSLRLPWLDHANYSSLLQNDHIHTSTDMVEVCEMSDYQGP